MVEVLDQGGNLRPRSGRTPPVAIPFQLHLTGNRRIDSSPWAARQGRPKGESVESQGWLKL